MAKYCNFKEKVCQSNEFESLNLPKVRYVGWCVWEVKAPAATYNNPVSVGNNVSAGASTSRNAVRQCKISVTRHR